MGSRVNTEIQRKKLQEKALREQQEQNRKFIDLLIELRRKDRISAEQFRDYRDQYTRNPQDRTTLTDKLERLR